jgi:hypothetical protein
MQHHSMKAHGDWELRQGSKYHCKGIFHITGLRNLLDESLHEPQADLVLQCLGWKPRLLVQSKFSDVLNLRVDV